MCSKCIKPSTPLYPTQEAVKKSENPYAALAEQEEAEAKQCSENNTSK